MVVGPVASRLLFLPEMFFFVWTLQASNFHSSLLMALSRFFLRVFAWVTFKYGCVPEFHAGLLL
jgi:hypothetical protein